MIIVGAKGFAKELLDVVEKAKIIKSVVFYDDINSFASPLLFEKFPVLRSENEVVEYFKSDDPRFTIGIGNPILRKRMFEKFIKLGGQFTSTISSLAVIGNHEVIIKDGANILPGAIISNNVSIGYGCIVYYNAIITHDVILGDFVEISPSATLLGRCSIGNFTQVGANATILPDIRIGNNVVIAAGSVVTMDVPDNCLVAGVPAKLKKHLKPLDF